MKRNQGFTLVEMLVSMVLLSMVLLIASGAYSLFSDRWNGRLGHFNQSMKTAKQLILVQESLKSIISYVVTNKTKEPSLYFEGNRNGFVAVTLRSLFNPETAAVIRLQVIQNEDFSYQLIYQESTMVEQLLINLEQPINFGDPIVLFDKLKDVNFQYFGWPSTESKYWTPDSPLEEPSPQAWFDEYNSLEIKLQPEQIKIMFSSDKGDFLLHTQLMDSIPNMLHRYAVEE
ncbi:PilW family protein [Thalassotalea agariperforans]